MILNSTTRLLRTCKMFGRRDLSFFDKVGRNWEKAWLENVTPWDTGTVTKPLSHAINSGTIEIRSNSRALVPGCGSGHDCNFLKKSGFLEVVGIDLSQTAIELCKTSYPNAALENVIFECADFFQYHNGKFDFIFDYLFFAALDPEMRIQWAESMARQITPNSGSLFTLMFPVDENNGILTGPPYNVHPNDYKAVLEPVGFRLVHIEKCESSIKPRLGREVVAYWKKVATEL